MFYKIIFTKFHIVRKEYIFLFPFFRSTRDPGDISTPSSRNLSQRRDTIVSVTCDTKRNDTYGSSIPLVSSGLCFHYIRNHSGIHRKAICRARHAHRARCMYVHTHTHARARMSDATVKKTGSRDKPELFARSLPQDRNNPLSHCRTLHE